MGTARAGGGGGSSLPLHIFLLILKLTISNSFQKILRKKNFLKKNSTFFREFFLVFLESSETNADPSLSEIGFPEMLFIVVIYKMFFIFLGPKTQFGHFLHIVRNEILSRKFRIS